MRFIYHPDNTIYIDRYLGTYAEFMATNPDFPLVEGEYFSYENEAFNLINSEGHNIPQKSGYENIIEAIGKL